MPWRSQMTSCRLNFDVFPFPGSVKWNSPCTTLFWKARIKRHIRYYETDVSLVSQCLFTTALCARTLAWWHYWKTPEGHCTLWTRFTSHHSVQGKPTSTKITKLQSQCFWKLKVSKMKMNGTSKNGANTNSNRSWFITRIQQRRPDT